MAAAGHRSAAVIGKRVGWLAVEMQDRDAVATAIKADAAPTRIYHLAGVPHVGDSWAHTRETFAGNVLAHALPFDAFAVTASSPRVLITARRRSTRRRPTRSREDDPVLPNSPYGTSKLAQEMVAGGRGKTMVSWH